MDMLKVAEARLQEFTGRFASVFPDKRLHRRFEEVVRRLGLQAQPG